MKAKNRNRLKSMEIQYSFCFLLIFLLITASSCQLQTKENIKETIPASQLVSKTQALLLTQDFAFDASDKNKVTGDYIHQKEVIIPQDLATQSKWIMFEGPVLENDLVAYRYYADSRHRFDIYGKTVSSLVMDTVSWKYHDIMNWGSDILKVGNSLGLGSPAIFYQDSLYYLSDCNQKSIQVIESSGHRSMIRTQFTGLKIGDHSFDLIQDWSIEAGQAWSEIQLKVVDGKLPEGMRFATGFVKHLPEIIDGSKEGIFYAMNWGKQSFHKEELGMAILANQQFNPEQILNDESHLYVFNNAQKELTYRFLSVWERDLNIVSNAKEFEELVERVCTATE